VAEECLGLQERLGLDVNLLLFAAYIGAVEGVALATQDVADAQARLPIGTMSRALAPRCRRALKAPSTDVANRCARQT